jgi:putative transposase
MHSRKIVGYDLSNSLELKDCFRALNKAIYQAKDIK